MSYFVDNAIILAADLSSRFAPLSYELPKALLKVKGEVLIERQIKQLHEAGIFEIIVVVGYKKELFEYLTVKYNVKLVVNTEYIVRNNHSSIYAAKDYLKNSYICTSDTYFVNNPFSKIEKCSYYSAVFHNNTTHEWCLEYNNDYYITNVTIGGSFAWCMAAHAFWTESFSQKFIMTLDSIYNKSETYPLFWEDIYIQHINKLPMKIKKYPEDSIFEFDTLNDLRKFDSNYLDCTNSSILQNIANSLDCNERDICDITPYPHTNLVPTGFYFSVFQNKYLYIYQDKTFKQLTKF